MAPVRAADVERGAGHAGPGAPAAPRVHGRAGTGAHRAALHLRALHGAAHHAAAGAGLEPASRRRRAPPCRDARALPRGHERGPAARDGRGGALRAAAPPAPAADPPARVPAPRAAGGARGRGAPRHGGHRLLHLVSPPGAPPQRVGGRALQPPGGRPGPADDGAARAAAPPPARHHARLRAPGARCALLLESRGARLRAVALHLPGARLRRGARPRRQGPPA